jgi:hypothetical protein
MDIALAVIAALLAIGTIHYARQAQAAAKRAAASVATMRAEAAREEER